MKTFIEKAKSHIDLFFLIILAAFLNIFDIWKLGYGNTYYASAIKSMMTNFSDFFFVSFDSTGFISVDKAPLSLWVDTIFAKVFGFSGVSILLPHALEGIAVTFLMYKIVKKIGGRIPAFLASLAITVSPVNVAVYRNNTPDALLLVFIMLSVWFVITFFEKQKIKYLLLSALMLGLGFNTKMLQAYLILPALTAAIFLFSPGKLLQRVKYTSIFLAVTILISITWISIVDLTPANLRPYVGGSTNDSAWNLALAYNGAERFTGESSVGGNAGFNVGGKGLLRLFQGELGTQAGWLLLSVLAYSIYFICKNFLLFFRKVRGKMIDISLAQIFTFIAILFFVIEYVFFSFASFFHSYYLNIFAISIAFLFGSLIYELYTSRFANKLLIFMLLAALPVQMFLISQTNYSSWLIPVILLGGLATLLMTLLGNKKTVLISTIIGGISLFLTPLVWSGYTTISADTAQAIFIGGPSVTNGTSMGPGGRGGQNDGGMFGGQSVNAAILAYLKAHYNGEKYFVGVISQQNATGFILNDNIGNVMTIGGFSGRDQAITLAQLKKEIAAGEIKYFLLGDGGPGGMGQGFGDGGPIGMPPAGSNQTSSQKTQNNNGSTGGGMFNANQDITNWIKANSTQVSGMSGLYECSTS